MIVWIDIRVSIVFFIVFVTNGQLGNVTIRLSDGIRKLKVGLLAPLNMTGGSVDAQDGNINQQIGFLRSAGAVMIALKRIADEQVLPNTNVTFSWYYDQCDEALAAEYTNKLILEDHVDVILGPACPSSALISAVIAKSYNIPIFIWGTSMPQTIDDPERFPGLASTSLNTVRQAYALLEVMKRYEWTEIALFYGIVQDFGIPRCSYFVSDVDTVFNQYGNISTVYRRNIANDSADTLNNILRNTSQRARIFVACFERVEIRRNFMLAMQKLNMINDEYVVIFIETTNKGFGDPPFWVDPSDSPDGKDDLAKGAFSKALVLDVQPYNQSWPNFERDVIENMKKWPFDQVCCITPNMTASQKSRGLADAFYLYALALNRSFEMYGADWVVDGEALMKNSAGEFFGFSGTWLITESGARQPKYTVWALDTGGHPQRYVDIRALDNATTWAPLYQNEVTSIWATRKDGRPLSRPKCGFDGLGCVDFSQYAIYVVIGSILVVILFVVVILVIYYAFRVKRKEQERLDAMWQIPFITLIKPQDKEELKSARSLQSSHSSTTRLTVNSIKDTDNHSFFFLNKELVIGRKHHVRPRIEKQDAIELRFIRFMNHENLNKFIGLSYDGPVFMTIWQFSHRGSLYDIIEKSSIQMDSFFMIALMRDIIEGITYIHAISALKQHGYLTSKTCLVNDRWQVKIQLYGLTFLKQRAPRSKKSLLWCAPEIIQENNLIGTQKGDIYSFAIIASEIVTRKTAWNISERGESEEEIIYRLKKGNNSSIRPSLDIDGALDLNTSVLHLIRDCWAENPDERPKADSIKSLLRTMQDGKSANLMDHVLNLLESYANNLEQEVEERTKELAGEKKKSDILLYRMLPKQVADSLKLGQSVPPENFDQATVFFCDVVSFTTLASRCTPLQVVNLLNDLYTTFDTIIDEHGVYKVETIGDGYLCVSGVPTRNGNRHAQVIAEMSFDFLRSLKNFCIPHLPSERINIRIGIHTGSVVAGVVGLTMPRYCLFGDTVNTASRMESNGKPGKIHLSPDANRYLTQIIGGYHTESRGEVIIKGKGIMETFWLLTEEERPQMDEMNGHLMDASKMYKEYTNDRNDELLST